MTNSINLYNYQSTYVNKLIKESEFTSKKQIAEKLGITLNALISKLAGRSIIYINEGFIIANELHMNINSIFCPTAQDIEDFMYRDMMFPINRQPDFKPYNPYNLNNEYVKRLITNNDLTLENVCRIWNMKIVCVYDKLKGKKKTSLKEGIELGNLLNMDIKYIFCPTNHQIVNYFMKLNTDKYFHNTKSEVTISLYDIDKYELKFTPENKKELQKLLYEKDSVIPDLKEVLEISSTHVYNKVNGKVSFNVCEVIKLCQWLNVKPSTIFNLKKEN